MASPQSSSSAVTMLARAGANPVATPSEAALQEEWGENQLAAPTWAGLQVLDEKDRSFGLLERIFMAGMRRSAPGTKVTSIRRCTNGGASGRLRARAFQLWTEATKAARGNANVKYGWYGASAAGIASVVTYGFGQPNNGRLRPEARAVGVFIAPPYFPHASVKISDPDEVGERHVVLCRVIMGNAEKVDADSPRWHPSSDQFDSGVDDVEKPRWYIVWGTHMNTHILPEYVVSFRTSDTARQVRRSVLQRAPIGRGIPFTELLGELGNWLPSSVLHVVEILFERFKAGKISRDVFLRKLAAIAGDKLLIVVKRFRNCS